MEQAGRQAAGVEVGWSRRRRRWGVRYIKCIYRQFSYFNRKKWSRQPDGGRGKGTAGEIVKTVTMRGIGWQVDEEEESGGSGGGLFFFLSSKNKKAFEWNLKKKEKKGEGKEKKNKGSGLNPGWGWTCHRGGFFGCRRRPPMDRRAVAFPGPRAQHLRETLRKGASWDTAPLVLCGLAATRPAKSFQRNSLFVSAFQWDQPVQRSINWKWNLELSVDAAAEESRPGGNSATYSECVTCVCVQTDCSNPVKWRF